MSKSSHLVCNDCFKSMVESLVEEKEFAFVVQTKGLVKYPAHPPCPRFYSSQDVLRYAPKLFD
jgi:hypothetical protein